MAERLRLMGQPLQPQALELPLRWKKPQRIFVNSMSDLFHDDVPLSFILDVFSVMNRASWHQFQILTKRAERLAELSAHLPWTPNIWMGVSVENAAYTKRIDFLRQTAAFVKFLSIEPLIGAVGRLNLADIDWVIVGGESGPGAREMKRTWVTDIRRQCCAAKVAFFFKQWGGVNKKRTGRTLDGRTYNEMPDVPLQRNARSLTVLAG
jgi:protein gp37